MSETQQRTFASGLSIQLGLLTVIADAVPVRATNSAKAVSFVQVCPVCPEPTKPQQEYACPNGHGPFAPSELDKARQTETGLKRIPKDDVESVQETGVSKGILTLNVCSSEELEDATRPDTASYRLRLGAKSQVGSYVLLRELVRNPQLAFYGVCQVNGRVTPLPFRLVVWRDQLVMQSLIRPADVAVSEVIENVVDENLLGMGKELVEKLVKPFDADALVDDRIAKLQAIITSLSGEPVSVVKPKVTNDLMEQLRVALEGAAA